MIVLQGFQRFRRYCAPSVHGEGDGQFHLEARYRSFWSLIFLVGLVACGTTGCSFAQDVVHTRAATDLACPVDQVRVVSSGGHSFTAYGCGASATYVCVEEERGPHLPGQRVSFGSESVCIREAATQAADTGTSQASTPTPTPFPDRVAGFQFGKSIAEAAKLCESAGYQWIAANADTGTCSSTPENVGWNATATLTFRDGALRGLLLSVPASDEDDAKSLTQFHELEKVLRSKYGAPTKREARNPPECLNGTSSCFKDGRAFQLLGWGWPSSSIKLRLGRFAGDSKGPLLFIEYWSAFAGAPAGARPSAL